MKVKWNSNFLENAFGNCRLTSRVRGSPFFRSEWRKFPHHLLNFPVFSLSSAENNYGNCRWQAPFRSVGLQILEKTYHYIIQQSSQSVVSTPEVAILKLSWQPDRVFVTSFSPTRIWREEVTGRRKAFN